MRASRKTPSRSPIRCTGLRGDWSGRVKRRRIWCRRRTQGHFSQLEVVHTGTNLRAWLLRILTNLNVDRGRKIQRLADAAARGDGLLPREQGRLGRRGGGSRKPTTSSSACPGGSDRQRTGRAYCRSSATSSCWSTSATSRTLMRHRSSTWADRNRDVAISTPWPASAQAAPRGGVALPMGNAFALGSRQRGPCGLRAPPSS